MLLRQEILIGLWVPLVGTTGDTRSLDIPSSYLDPALDTRPYLSCCVNLGKLSKTTS